MHASETDLFGHMVAQSRLAMVASDMGLPDRPLVFVNDAFVSMTGFSRAEAVGRNCRFLQGADTDPATVDAVRETILAGRDGYFELLNYRKDGSRFWNGLHIGPMSEGDGGRTLYFGAQRDVTIEVEAREAELLRAREIAHRMGNLLAIVATMVRSSAQGEGEDALRAALERRLFALSRSNALVSPTPDPLAPDGQVPLVDVLRTVLEPIAGAERFTLSGEAADIASGDVANVALTVHELATNALKHGALSNASGTVSLRWQRLDGRVLIDWTESGGPSVAAARNERRGMGTRLLKAVARGSHRSDAGLERPESGLFYRFDVAGV